MELDGSGDRNKSPYDEIRQRLVDRGQRRIYRTVPNPRQGFRALKRVIECTAVLLDTPLMLVLAGFLALTPLLALGLYPMSGADSAGLGTASETGQERPALGTDSLGEFNSATVRHIPAPSMRVARVNDLALEVLSTPLEVSEPVAKNPPSELREAFVVQVGTFRSSSNAQRVARALRKQGADVPISVHSGRLHTVRVGPFPEEGIAVDSARSIEQTLGLLPLVIRLDVQ